MDANQRMGAGIILMGVSAIFMTVPISITSYPATFSFLMPVVGIIAAISLIGMGIGIYTGKFETTSGTVSKQSTVLIVIIAVVAFAIGVLLAIM